MRTSREPGLVFVLPDPGPLGRALLQRPGVERAKLEARTRPLGETRIALAGPVRGRRCAVLGAVSPAPRLAELLLACHTIRREGASEVVAAIPYLAYSRQDKPEEGKSLGLEWLGAILKASGVDRVLTVDVHSSAAARLLRLPVRSLSPAPLLAAAIPAPAEATFVAPDEGAEDRCRELARAAGSAKPLVTFKKTRTAGGVRSAMRGVPGLRAVIVDDILDTGATIVACCRALQNAGTRKIAVVVSHALFTGGAGRALWSCGIRRVICTDTTPLTDPCYRRRATVVSVADLLGKELWTTTASGRREEPA